MNIYSLSICIYQVKVVLTFSALYSAFESIMCVLERKEILESWTLFICATTRKEQWGLFQLYFSLSTICHSLCMTEIIQKGKLYIKVVYKVCLWNISLKFLKNWLMFKNKNIQSIGLFFHMFIMTFISGVEVVHIV